MKLSVTALLLYLLYGASTFAAPSNTASLAEIARARPDDLHPLDLYPAHLLKRAPPTANQDFRLTVNTTRVSGVGREWVTVTWEGVSRPSSQDVVALYAADAPDWMNKAPIKALAASNSESHMETGSGSFE